MRAATVQMNSTDDVDRNLETADRLTRAAAKDGAELVVLPEKWPALGRGDVAPALERPAARDERGPDGPEAHLAAGGADGDGVVHPAGR